MAYQPYAAGDTAHDAVDSGNPIKIGGKANSSAPTPVAAADRTDAWFDLFGRQAITDLDPETGVSSAVSTLRDKIVAQRYTILSDSVADGLATFWTSSTASGGTNTTSGGEGLIQTSANAAGSAQLVSPTPYYLPGQVAWFNSAMRLGDTGNAGNIRRWGVFTVSGTTPQEGFYYELSATTLNAVVVKAGSATAVASASWSRVTAAPFTLDTNYHSFEIRWTANYVGFYIDNVLRHTVAGTTSPITSTLNLPMAISNVNTSGATNRVIAVRNCGIGRFGTPDSVTGSSIETTSGVSASASSVTLLVANSARKGATFYNASTATLYLHFGATASIASGGYIVAIPPSGYYELPKPTRQGIITGIWSAANGYVNISESI